MDLVIIKPVQFYQLNSPIRNKILSSSVSQLASPESNHPQHVYKHQFHSCALYQFNCYDFPQQMISIIVFVRGLRILLLVLFIE